MIYAKISSEEARKRLNEAIEEAKDVKWYIRLQIISFSSTKKTVAELSKMFKLCHGTIRRYIHSYNCGGLKELMPGKSPGRPPKIGQWTKQDWYAVMEQTPNQYEKLETGSHQWTLERLQRYVKEYHSIDVSLSSIHNSLMNTGRRTGRSKLRVGSPDPMYTVKRSYTKEVQNLHFRDN